MLSIKQITGVAYAFWTNKKYKDRKSGHISSVKKYSIKTSTSAFINHLRRDHGLQLIFNSAIGQSDTNVHAFNDENEVDNPPNSITSSVNDVDYSVPKNNQRLINSVTSQKR